MGAVLCVERKQRSAQFDCEQTVDKQTNKQTKDTSSQTCNHQYLMHFYSSKKNVYVASPEITNKQTNSSTM
jgi:hypothetical protein